MSSTSILDIPTALTTREAEALADMAKGRRVLEIGSLLGYSTITMAKTALQVWAVDPHSGYPEGAPRPTLNIFMDNLTKYNMYNKVVPVIARAQDVLGSFDEDFFEMVFIDTMGDYAGTMEIMNLIDFHFFPDFLCVHDYGHKVWSGATQAVKEFSEKLDWEYGVIDTLAVFS